MYQFSASSCDVISCVRKYPGTLFLTSPTLVFPLSRPQNNLKAQNPQIRRKSTPGNPARDSWGCASPTPAQPPALSKPRSREWGSSLFAAARGCDTRHDYFPQVSSFTSSVSLTSFLSPPSPPPLHQRTKLPSTTIVN